MLRFSMRTRVKRCSGRKVSSVMAPVLRLRSLARTWAVPRPIFMCEKPTQANSCPSRSKTDPLRRSPASITAYCPREARLKELQGFDVALRPFALDDADAGFTGDRLAAPLLALVDVGDVDLDRRQVHRLQRVKERVTVVGQGARVEDQRVGILVGGRLDAIDEVALVVGLVGLDGPAQLGAAGDQHLFDLAQGGGAVDRGLADSETVEVGAIEDHDEAHLSRACRRRGRGRRRPAPPRPGPGCRWSRDPRGRAGPIASLRHGSFCRGR